MDRFQQGDMDAWGELYTLHHSELTRWIRGRYRCQKQEAEDLASETFNEIRLKRHQFEPDRGSFVAWRNAIAGGLILTVIRTRARHPSIQIDDALPLVHPNKQESIDCLLDTLKLIERLPPKQRGAVRRVIQDELDRRRKSVGNATFACQLHHARKKLRDWTKRWGSLKSPGGTAKNQKGLPG